MFNSRPTICPLCQGKVSFGLMKDYKIKPFQSGHCYICEKCGSYVGTHKKNPRDALGIISDKKTRYLRAECHIELDKHWNTSREKNLAYYKLAKEMEIKFENCHFGYMTYDQLITAKRIMEKWR